MLYDIHCHLDKQQDPEAAVRRAREAGLSLILTNGTGPEDNREALRLQAEHDIVRAALGLYPGDAVKLTADELHAELEFIRSNDPIAIGEVGLDYHWDDTKKEAMKRVFEKVIRLAEETQKPLLVHSRKAEDDVISLLSGRKAIACLHCFGGSLKLAKKAAVQGIYFSIPATVQRSVHFQRLVEELPSHLLLIETDSPWLSPTPGEENEPANVLVAAQTIAQVRGLSLENTANLLRDNLNRFLGEKML
jgi:TatD DNase family protein